MPDRLRALRAHHPLFVDGRFVWTPDPRGLQLHIGEKVYRGFRALHMVVLLNPVTYFAIAVSIAALGDVPGPAVLYRRLIVGTCLVVLMPPLAWIADLCFGEAEQRSARVVQPEIRA